MSYYGQDYDEDGQVVTEEAHRGQLRIAERVVGEHGVNLRHVTGLGWHLWTGTHWREDDDEAPSRKVLRTVKRSLAEAVSKQDRDEREALMADCRKAESAAGLSGVLFLTARHRPVAVSHKVLDRDAWLFNTTTGTVDLRDGSVRDHDRLDHITKLAQHMAPEGQAADEWHQFLEHVLPDPAVRQFLKRLIGYSMLGEVREHYLPILTGTGANGKSVFRDVVLHAFGDYACEVDPELLMETKHVRHGTFKMQLRGRRLVFCSETEKGRRFAEATMKRLTGGDPIEANRMRQDPIMFYPSHTLLMVTNHLPVLSSDDDAVWRRILVIPFDVVIPPEERDKGLTSRLKRLAPSVVRWAYEGWLEYQADGLEPPATVQQRTKQYQADSDSLGRFLTERCLISQSMTANARHLYVAYERWCSDGNERALSEKEFATAMGRRGMEKRRTPAGYLYHGLGIMSSESDPQKADD